MTGDAGGVDRDGQLRALIMDVDLTVPAILERAERHFAGKAVISRSAGGVLDTYSYGEVADRVRRLGAALQGLGVREGDRVASVAWNSHRHLELYFAVPSIGAVLHTANFRLAPDELRYCLAHGGAEVIFCDPDHLAVVREIAADLPHVRHLVAMDAPAVEPSSNDASYEDLLKTDRVPRLPALDERSAATLCYTSGTTGRPKAVTYSHRGLALLALTLCTTDVLALGEDDTALVNVPMFHANAWCLPYGATMCGATQVLPGPAPAPHDLATLIDEYRVTYAAAVPTVLMGMLDDARSHGHDLASLRLVGSGGAALPTSLVNAMRDAGVNIRQGWGMTETGPVATMSWVKSDKRSLPLDEQTRLLVKQGTPLPFVSLRVVDDRGTELPWDGTSTGELEIRGPWVASDYFKDHVEHQWHDGWMRTGDVVTIDSDGCIEIVDRTKDLIKSGGEWISSLALEDALTKHPRVVEAAVVAMTDPVWQERPAAFVVAAAGEPPTQDELREFLAASLPKWWLPDRFLFVNEIAKTSVGKLNKKVLREQLKVETGGESEGAVR